MNASIEILMPTKGIDHELPGQMNVSILTAATNHGEAIPVSPKRLGGMHGPRYAHEEVALAVVLAWMPAASRSYHRADRPPKIHIHWLCQPISLSTDRPTTVVAHRTGKVSKQIDVLHPNRYSDNSTRCW